MLPFSAASERNKDVILEKMTPILRTQRKVLEIGSGTGQHAVHITAAVPHVFWQCSDLDANLPGIAARLAAEGNPRTPPPLALEAAAERWPLPAPDDEDAFDTIFTANTLHIMSFERVSALFAHVGDVLSAENGKLCVYGPLKYGGAFTTQSNADFDRHLKSADPVSGIRDFEALDDLARDIGLRLEADIAMPANNQLVVWQRQP